MRNRFLDPYDGVPAVAPDGEIELRGEVGPRKERSRARIVPAPALPVPRRVLILSYEYPPLGGGGGVIFRDLAEELAKRIDVTVLTSGRAGLPREERSGRLRIVRTPVLMRDADATATLPSLLSFFPSSLAAGANLLRKDRYDILHSSFAVPSGPSGVLLSRMFRIPHVLTVHGGDIYDPSKRLSPHRTPLLKQTVAWVVHASDRVVAQSRDTAQRTTSIYGERDLDRIPLAVRPVRFEPCKREAFGIPESDILLTTIGRLIPRKGLHDLLEIVAGLREPNARLLVIGDGPLRPELQQRAHELGIGSRVCFTGFVSDEEKWQLLHLSDLYVSTTLHEGFGIVFLEAMESGVPVVCYDRGGQVDFVDSEVGALVPLGDRARFAAEVERHVSDRRMLAMKRTAARERARCYHVDRFADRYLRIYGECMQGQARVDTGLPCSLE